MLARIYKITNLITNKCYIGFTVQKYLSTRMNRHFYNARIHNSRYNSKLYNSMQKYPRDTFIIEEIYCSKDKEYCLKIMEPYFIKEYNTYNIGYNTSLGGEGTLGYRHTLETKKKISEKSKLQVRSTQNRIITSKCNSRKYKLVSTHGSIYEVINLYQWCKQMGISYYSLLQHKQNLKYGIASIEKVA